MIRLPRARKIEAVEDVPTYSKRAMPKKRTCSKDGRLSPGLRLFPLFPEQRLGPRGPSRVARARPRARTGPPPPRPPGRPPRSTDAAAARRIDSKTPSRVAAAFSDAERNTRHAFSPTNATAVTDGRAFKNPRTSFNARSPFVAVARRFSPGTCTSAATSQTASPARNAAKTRRVSRRPIAFSSLLSLLAVDGERLVEHAPHAPLRVRQLRSRRRRRRTGSLAEQKRLRRRKRFLHDASRRLRVGRARRRRRREDRTALRFFFQSPPPPPPPPPARACASAPLQERHERRDRNREDAIFCFFCFR